MTDEWYIVHMIAYFNPIALRKAKIVYKFGLSECNRVKSFPRAFHSGML